MSKSSMEDVIEATRIVNKLDKRGKLAILNDLLKQDLTPRAKGDTRLEGAPAKVIAKYTEGVEK